MPKKSHQKHIRLNNSLFARLTEAAKEADMSVNQLIIEAIKFYLYERGYDPSHPLYLKNEETSTLSKPEETHLFASLQTYYLVHKWTNPSAEVLKEASEWAKAQVSQLVGKK
jgi:hypothetical protein